MRGNFEVPILGKCLIGTYALRKLTKLYDCVPAELLTLATKSKTELDFMVNLFKFSRENHIIQYEGIGKLEEVSEYEAEKAIDEMGFDGEKAKSILNALCLSISGKTFDELAETANNSAEETEAPSDKKKDISSTGKKLIK